MNLSDLNNLDLKNLDLKDIAAASVTVKAVILVVLFVAILALGWYLVWSGGIKELEAARSKEQELRQEYTKKKAEVFYFKEHEKRLEEVKLSLQTLLQQLPERSQMEQVLIDINQAGIGRGLEFELFRPGTESLTDIYATLPVAIKVSGTYHNIGGFVSDLTQLKRIVTLHDITLMPVKDNLLSMDLRIQTYRSLDEGELAEAKRKKSEAKK
jgi:type IV pilus assembly protein PilO